MAHTLRSVVVFTTAPATIMEHSNVSSTTVNTMAAPTAAMAHTLPMMATVWELQDLSRRSQQHMAVACVCTIAAHGQILVLITLHTKQWGCLLAPVWRSTSSNTILRVHSACSGT
jgi:hypothetical protein